MAAAFFEDQDSFNCSVCLDLLKEPVSIPCGHSYCLGCIESCWDQDQLKGVYSCPECRQTFVQRPVLNRNTLLAKVVQKLKITSLQAALPVCCYAGPGDVECDSCTRRKNKAVKSCLVCLASFCETHLQPHYDSPAFKKHTLVDASTNLQEKICSRHNKLLEVFCRNEQQCICYLCTMDEHKGHDTVSAAAEKDDKQKQLEKKRNTFQQRIQKSEKEIQKLRQAVDSLKLSAQTAMDDSEKVFAELISHIEEMGSEVKKLIRDQEKTEVDQVEGLLEKLEKEVSELKRRDAEVEGFLHTEDLINFLQKFKDNTHPESGKVPDILLNQRCDFKIVMNCFSTLKKQLMTSCKNEVMNVSKAVKGVHILKVAASECQSNIRLEEPCFSLMHNKRLRNNSQDLFFSQGPGFIKNPW